MTSPAASDKATTYTTRSTQGLRGVLAPVLTPMRPDFSVDTQKWIAFARSLLAGGCTGLAPFGTTSEANSLGIEERMDLLEELVAAGVPAEKLLPGTGTCALSDTVKLSSQAARLGCAGVLLLPPFYYKGVSDEGVFRATAELIERTGDRALRVYLYHIPPIAIVGYSLPVIERLVSAYPDTVVGMKDSGGDWSFQEAVLTSFPGFNLFSGTEKFLVPNLRHQGAGTISAMANIIPGKIREVYDYATSQEGRTAQDLDQRQVRLDQYRASLRDCPPIPAIKELVAARSADPAWRTVCPPLIPLNSEQRAGLLSRFGSLPQ